MKLDRLILVPALVAASCGKSATGPAQGPSGEFPQAGSDGGALVVAAETRVFDDPAVLWTVVTVRNDSDQTVDLVLSGSCPVVLRAYRDAARTAPAAWDGDRLDRCAPEIAALHRIQPGDSIQAFFDAHEEEILGDSLPPGRYHLSALLRGSGATRREIPTADVALSGARRVDVAVPRGETRTVPGTDLAIELVDVTDDQRCPLRDADGNPIVCVWQGNADLTLGLSAEGLEDQTRVMRSGFEPVVEYGPFRIAFFGLVPERSLDTTIDPHHYVATFRVTVPRERQGR